MLVKFNGKAINNMTLFSVNTKVNKQITEKQKNSKNIVLSLHL